ncbi:MAG: tetratricopeptide repeat protein [Candidatus Lokiarchaeota archaeon]|nr:tetratricopeptide repeat protein [Candidatus Lokiarchaeota archaeon]
MPITPLSHNEIQNLRDFIEKSGWYLKGYIENIFRFSLRKDKTLIFTVKFPAILPIRLNIPFELANFKISIAFKFWNLDTNIYDFIHYLQKSIRDLALVLSIENNFPMEGRKKILVEILNLIIPDTIRRENEKAWVNRIRISLMNKREKLDILKPEEITNIVKELNNIGLKPTFNLPWELNKGIPKLRTSETIFFSTEEMFDEFFILEKDFFTYFKDLKFKKVYIRSFFESYCPLLIQNLFKNTPEVQLKELINYWIKFSRSILNSIIEIIKKYNLNDNILVAFSPDKQLEKNNFLEEDNNFPFSALHYECLIAKELFPIHNDLLSLPPNDFEVIENLSLYTKAEELMNNYKFKEASAILTNALKIFNKHKQKKMVVSILLFLNKIALTLDQKDVAVNYLESALSIAKSGEISIIYIIEIHYNLAKIYYKLKFYARANEHFVIIQNFLENEELKFEDKGEYQGLSLIFLGLIAQELEENLKAKEYFKKALQIGNKSVKVKLKYHLLRAKYYKTKGKLPLVQKMLKAGLIDLDFSSVDSRSKNILTNLLMEIAEYYIHDRTDRKKADYYLKGIKKSLIITTIPGIKKSIRWNLLMNDYYKFLMNDEQKAQFYFKRSQELQNQLRIIGLKE